MQLEFLLARDLPDAWFQCICRILDAGQKYKIDRGSYAGQFRLEFDYITIHIKYPGVRPLLPDIPPSLGIPNPVADDYLEQYLPYLMTSAKHPTEDYCYSKDTEILTESGWKPFPDLDGTEFIASLNPCNNEIEYQRPLKYVQFDYCGELFELNGKKINFMVNEGHKLYAAAGGHSLYKSTKPLELIEVEKTLGSKYLKFNRSANWVADYVGEFILPTVKYNNSRYNKFGTAIRIPMDSWLKFFGIWLAEGSLRKGRDTAYNVVITIVNSKDRAFIFENVVKPIFPNAFVYGKDIILSNKQLFNYLSVFGKAGDKFIPREIMGLPSEQLSILYDYMMFGDGNKNGFRYNTKSKKLANDFSELCLKTGRVGIVKFDSFQSKNSYKNNGIYRIYISNNKELVVENKIKRVEYKGKLYCVMLPKYHIIYIRRKGAPHWSGNTYGQYLEPQIAEIINIYKKDGFNTNQAYMTVGDDMSIYLNDPPCLRGIDTRIRDGKLHFIVYFRSWDLFGGFPANLGAIQLLKEYMSEEIGVEDGEIIASSKGLHLYDYSWDIAKLRVCGHV